MKKTVEIKNLDIKEVSIFIKGVSPLIVNRCYNEIPVNPGEEAKTRKRKERNIQEEFQLSKHISEDGWEGFPASGFKGAIIRAAKVCGLVMKDTQVSFFIKPDCRKTQLVRIFGEAQPRHDVARNTNTGAAIQVCRPEYKEWDAILNIEYNEGMISTNQLFQLVSAAGWACGIGIMRPEKGKHGYGRWELVTE